MTPPSLWHETAGAWTPRPPLPGDVSCDVAIVGAGFTGLWTAYYLALARPDLRIVVLEAKTAGFGASGRNGGWCSALFPASLDTLAAMSSRSAALAQHAAMRASVDEVVSVATAEGIGADIAKGGTIVLARSAAQLARARAEVESAAGWGLDGLILLSREEALARVRASGVLGATYTPDCAALHPAKLVRGLATAVERYGVALHELTRVTAIEPHRVSTAHGIVTADVVVRATEGYTAALPGFGRALAPVYSLIVATAPLSGSLWAEIGLERRETFSDHRHLIVYGQRTADDRLVFGGRGAPYPFRSRVDPRHERDERVFARLREAVVDLFPALTGVAFTHAWGGALGVPRDWCASVGLDPENGLAWAGGYVGDGVSTTNLAGRTLRDLILGIPSELTALPWVGHRSPAWEPEPLRWLGVNAGLRAMTLADTEERLTGRPSLIARAVSPLLG
ncbi:FAD-binding oxidoreductase [Nocardioides sp.]|uniref:NAD(P)/FAD-dependent oxidoreductase n=1 Tax=Nocardioides sp. TaxID=35761 RepID=UPI002BCAFE89|nr:FAD-binding oxidoreductase [Nocardioides sp.]HVX53284.1 FAD-binding oxidoreductase [Nocardioides sp.]